jgi:hypothetical protein
MLVFVAKRPDKVLVRALSKRKTMFQRYGSVNVTFKEPTLSELQEQLLKLKAEKRRIFALIMENSRKKVSKK